jgi:hypothetical protein
MQISIIVGKMNRHLKILKIKSKNLIKLINKMKIIQAHKKK